MKRCVIKQTIDIKLNRLKIIKRSWILSQIPFFSLRENYENVARFISPAGVAREMIRGPGNLSSSSNSSTSFSMQIALEAKTLVSLRVS